MKSSHVAEVQRSGRPNSGPAVAVPVRGPPDQVTVSPGLMVAPGRSAARAARDRLHSRARVATRANARRRFICILPVDRVISRHRPFAADGRPVWGPRTELVAQARVGGFNENA